MIHGIKISAAKRYPLAITRMARERTMRELRVQQDRSDRVAHEHRGRIDGYECVDAVKVDAFEGAKAINRKTINMPQTTARASPFCAALGEDVERMKCCSAGLRRRLSASQRLFAAQARRTASDTAIANRV